MPTISLNVEGLGHVPSFKNSKKIVRFGSRMSLITDPKKRQWMDRCTQSFVSQLRSVLATADAETQTGCNPPCLTALLPQDDNLFEIELGPVTARMATKGSEGAVVTIENLCH